MGNHDRRGLVRRKEECKLDNVKMWHHIESQPNHTSNERLCSAKKSATGSLKEQLSAASEVFDGNPCSGMPMHNATLKDLCEEDKQKVARLIRQVVSLTKEKEALKSEASAEHARQAVVVEALQEQNRDLLAEVTSLRLKLLQAHGHLRTYQLKLRAIKDGTNREAGPPLESPPSVPPSLSANVIVPPEPPQAQSEVPLRVDSSSKGAHLASAAPLPMNVLDDVSSPLVFTTTSLPSPPHSLPSAPAAPSGQPTRGPVGTMGNPESRSATTAVVPPSGGVWAAWAELEQRIRSVTGELAHRGPGQGGSAVLSRGLGEVGRLDTGLVAEGGALPATAAAHPVSSSHGAVRGGQLSGAASVSACASLATQSVPGEAQVHEEHTGSRSDAPSQLGAPNGGPLLVAGPAVPQPPPISRMPAASSPFPYPPIAGGPVIQPRPISFPYGARPLSPPPSIALPGMAVPEVKPSVTVPPPLIGDLLSSDVAAVLPRVPMPDIRPSSPAVSPGFQSENRPPLPGMAPRDDRSQTSAVGVAPLAGASLISLDANRVPLHTGAHLGKPLVGSSGDTLGPGRPEVGGGALLAAVVESDLAALEHSRPKEGSRGRCDDQREADAESREMARGDHTRVLRFDPTVGEAGAFFYVDVSKKDEATQVEERTGEGERSEREVGAGEMRAGAANGEAEEDRMSATQTLVREVIAEDIDKSDDEGGQSAREQSPKRHKDRATKRVPDLPTPDARQPPRVLRPTVFRQQTPREPLWSPEAQLSSPVHGRGRARWVSGMLYDSALLELVEELEMEHGRKERQDRVEGPLPTWTGGSSKAEAVTGTAWGVPRATQPDKGRGRRNEERHLRSAHAPVQPEVLILSTG